MALYSAHRPQTFANVIGQEAIKQTIQNQIITGQVSHAYLFSGPRGVGKTTTARLIAKAVNVPRVSKDSADPDNTHELAKHITTGTSLDVIEIDAASNTGVDHVREHIIESVQFRPTQLKYKVFIIDEVHMLSKSAFNALLKTLEEPPEYVIFILATTELHKVPATILSRCQHFQFQKVPQDVLINHIAGISEQSKAQVHAEVLKEIAYNSDGCVRDAISLLEQVIGLKSGEITSEDVAHLFSSSTQIAAVRFVEALTQKDAATALNTIDEQRNAGIVMQFFADQSLQIARLLMISNSGANMPPVSPAIAHEVARIAKQTTSEQALVILEHLLKYRNLLKRSPIDGMALEMCVVELTGEFATPSQQLPKAQSPHPVVQSKIVQQEQPPEPLPIAIQDEPQKKLVQEEIPVENEPAQTDTSYSQEYEPPQEEPAADQLSETTQLTKEKVQKHWSAFLQQMTERAPSLLIILNSASIGSVQGKTIEILVQNSFYQKKLMQTSCNTHIEECFAELFEGNRPIITITVDATTAAPNLNSLTAAFGGSVIIS